MIGIVYIGNINRAPFIKNYTDELDRACKEYEIIFWDRSRVKSKEYLKTNATKYHIFNLNSKEMQPPILKIKDFYNFRKYVNRLIKENHYEKLILLTTMSALIVYPLLKREYKGKYIFDYRDASYEFSRVFSYYLKKIVVNSYFTAVSSKGFFKILPNGKNKYILVHNNKYTQTSFINLSNEPPINVTYIGGLRESDYMKQVISSFANDSRFKLSIYGGGENLSELLDWSKNFDNIRFYGPYSEKDKEKILDNANLILYNYPNSYINNYATANKMYDGIFKGIPMIGNTGTFSGDFIEENNIGVNIDLYDNDFSNMVFKYYSNLDLDSFKKSCTNLSSKVLEDNNKYQEYIRKFING